MKTIYTTTLLEEANLIQLLLRDHRIESSLENQGGAMYAVGVPSAAVPLAITVLEKDAEKGTALIKDWLEKRG